MGSGLKTAVAVACMLLIDGCKPVSDPNYCKVPWRKLTDESFHLVPYSVVNVKRHRKLTWNGVAVTEAKMLSYLELAEPMNPMPGTVFKFDRGTTCRDLEHIVKLTAALPACERCEWDGDLPVPTKH